MLHKTTGIVLNVRKYNDKTLLIHILTEDFGNTTYAVVPGSSKKNGRKSALFQPFSILDLEVEHKSNREIHRIKESKINYPSKNIHLDPVRISISLFLAEFVFRSVKDTSPNRALFHFIFQSIQVLDLSAKSIANFHLVFLLKLTQHLGFYPNLEANKKYNFFDMLNGVFVASPPAHKHYLQNIDVQLFINLMRMNYNNMHLFSFSRKERNNIIYKIIEYYKLHLTEFSEPKSLEILQALFD